MGLKLNGATSGSIEIDVPAVAGTDTAITIPATTGGEFIVSDSAGDVNIDSGTFFVDASTNQVGIGTTSPNAILELENQGDTKAIINARTDAANGSIATLELWSKNSGGTNNFGFISYDGDDKMEIGTGGSGDGSIDIAFAGASGEAMRIDNSGRLVIGHPGNFVRGNLQVVDGGGGELTIARNDTTVASGNDIGHLYFASNDANTGAVTCASIECYADADHTGDSSPTYLVFATTESGDSSPTEAMRIDNTRRLFCTGVYNSTTASGANVRVDSNGHLRRSTSSAKYKTDIETLEDSYADALLGCRPVWYRSICEGDNSEHGWWGFIAEEVAAIDPRLVHWKTFEVTYDDEGSAVTTPCEPEAEGVAYERFVPHLLNLIKRQKEQLETQAATIAALDARLTALEGGAE